MTMPSSPFVKDQQPASVPIWREALAGLDWMSLRASPVFYGCGVPRGDGAAVVLVPGFLASDWYLFEIHAWLTRIGYRAFMSRVGRNADCLDVIADRLFRTIESAAADEWAEGLCTAVTDLQTSLQEVVDEVTNVSSFSTETLDGARDDVRTATETFRDDVSDLGTPDTESGEEAKQAVDDFSSTLESESEDIEETIFQVTLRDGKPVIVVYDQRARR